MNYPTIFLLVAVGVFIGMLGAVEIGKRIGIRRMRPEDGKEQSAFGLLDGAVFGLLGLLIAFTFNVAGARFDDRKEIAIQEANAIGTAYLRLDLLPVESQSGPRDLFRQYVDMRLETYRKLPDLEAAEISLAQMKDLQQRIWLTSVAACQAAGSVATTNLLLTALNEMFDLATFRIAGQRLMHTTIEVYVMLCVLAIISALLVGYTLASTKRIQWIHVLSYASMVAITIYVILDLEYPRVGLIRLDQIDQVLVDVRKGMD